MYETAHYASPMGNLTLAGDGESLAGLWIEGQKYFGGAIADALSPARGSSTVIDAAKNWLDRYFAGERPGIRELPLAPAGGFFRQTIWKLLCEIPYGTVATYGELAQKAAKELGRETMSAQAVGGAIGHNPISIIIPCHRVVGGDGSLTGYAGGLAVKLKLLELEGTDLTKLYLPGRGTAL